LKIYNYTNSGYLFQVKDVGTWEQLDETDELRTVLNSKSNRLALLQYLLPKYSISDAISSKGNTLNIMKIDVGILLKIKSLIVSYEI